MSEPGERQADAMFVDQTRALLLDEGDGTWTVYLDTVPPRTVVRRVTLEIAHEVRDRLAERGEAHPRGQPPSGRIL